MKPQEFAKNPVDIGSFPITVCIEASPQSREGQDRDNPREEVIMALPPLTMQSDVRKAIREANRLAGILQSTMSLEGQGLEGREFREVKRHMIRRILRVVE